MSIQNVSVWHIHILNSKPLPYHLSIDSKVLASFFFFSGVDNKENQSVNQSIYLQYSSIHLRIKYLSVVFIFCLPAANKTSHLVLPVAEYAL